MSIPKNAYEGSEPYVFISYAHKDSEIVLPLIRGLQDRGFRAWYDAGLEVGTEWADRIAEHLEKSACVIAFVSVNFGASHNCRREVDFAIELRKDPIVVYMEEREQLPAGLRMQLGSLHALFYQRFSDNGEFLDALCEATALQPCLDDSRKAVSDDDTEDKTQLPADFPMSSQTNNVDALFRLGYFSYSGEGLPQDFETAAALFAQAAQLGHVDAQYNLGVCYYCGCGVDQDYAEAVKWYRMAAEQGSPQAQYMMGLCCELGKGLPGDMTEAVRWYRLAAEQGHIDAQYSLGGCYEYGDGIPVDAAEAVKWYRMAADQGDALSQFSLGVCYADGEGVAQDMEEAVRLYRLSAEQRCAAGQVSLGRCYEYGTGVAQSYPEALKWYRLAAEQGDSEGRQCLESVLNKLGQTQ